jgi:hypothetical protein
MTEYEKRTVKAQELIANTLWAMNLGFWTFLAIGVLFQLVGAFFGG